ncbi:hypothetical protein C2845_PM01G43560 [Panicum miliaceum]|uniref:Chloride conductance regulatory protein ICln-like n=1 Tax=Panicum miliaceum TaxID=4540 RepID=A0A3L6TW74_PANMI|nr:hypothetical protein C2845_PM01G43560 [Panicum miliaceum]
MGKIETEAGSDDESDESDSEVNGEIELSKVTEMRIIPTDPGQLDGLFEAFSHCAELYPDPNADSDEENGWVHGDEDMTDGFLHLEDNMYVPMGDKSFHCIVQYMGNMPF